jgi:RimJ/RimL family protein N-acetyltransferase
MMRFPEHFPSLPTERLELRALTPADVEGVFAIYADPEVMRYWSRPPMQEQAEAEALIGDATQAFATGDSFRWGLQSRVDGRMIGTVSLFHLDAQNRRAEIGYALHRSRWGQGLMQEALRATIVYAFDTAGLDLGRLEADLDPRNAASARLLERLGFAREGLLRERWIVAGELSDSLLMGLLRREWRR